MERFEIHLDGSGCWPEGIRFWSLKQAVAAIRVVKDWKRVFLKQEDLPVKAYYCFRSRKARAEDRCEGAPRITTVILDIAEP